MLEQIRMLSDGDDTFVYELMESFRQQFISHLPEMKDLLESGQWESARAICHKLKGAALNMGARRLSAKLQVMEQLLMSPLPDWSQHWQPLSQDFEEAYAHIEQFLVKS